ncbi:dipeptide ABC transporter ATP-binding protein [Streptomyces shenzhenensis]|uniref:dipeptide ABC transporter ATP-binding protein n=1 Tax=Streptomyces shenzhenensis TaxID=943815 RepID=UPI00340AEE5B
MAPTAPPRTRVTDLPASFWWLWLSVLVIWTGRFVVPFLTLFLTDTHAVGLSTAQAGGVMAAYGAGIVISALVGGVLADRLGRKRTLVGSQFASAGALILIPQFIAQPVVLVPLLTLYGLLNGAGRPSIAALVGDLAGPRHRRGAYSYHTWAVNLGYAIGPIIAGLVTRAHYALLFYGQAAVAIVGALIVTLFVHDPYHGAGRTGPSAPGTGDATTGPPTAQPEAGHAVLPGERRGLKTVLTDRVFMIFLAAMFCYYCVYVQSTTTLPVVMASQGLSNAQYSYLLTLNGLLLCALQIPSLRILTAKPHGVLMVAFTLVTTVGMVVQSTADTEWIYVVSVTLWTLGELGLHPTAQSTAADLADSELRGRYQGAYALAFSGASMIAPIAGGAVLDRFGPQVMWLGCAGLCVAAAIALGLTAPRRDLRIRELNSVHAQPSSDSEPARRTSSRTLTTLPVRHRTEETEDTMAHDIPVAAPTTTQPATGAGPTQQPPPPVASIRDLKVSLARGGTRTEVLHGVDLDIERGEIVALVGESGSGKSVLGLALMGLLPQTSHPHVTGSATIAGVDMVTAKAEARRRTRRDRLGVVFQDPMTSLNPTTRVGKQIMEVTGDRDEALRVMRAVGVPEPEQRLSAFPHELSGGLRQRVMIAMAVAGSPELIIADEPTTALDVTVQAQVLGVLAELRGELGCSILMVTHDLGVAAQIADRIVVMRHGEFVEQGRTQDVLERPRHSYTRRLLRARLGLDTDRTRSLPSGDDDQETAPLDRTRATNDPMLELTDVHCDFKVKDGQGRRALLHALRGVTTAVTAGESLALVGESGSGKSTLLRAIAGLETRWNGRIDKPAPHEIQMVFQDAGASLTPWLTVEDTLLERLRRTGLTRTQQRRRIAETLELMSLPEGTLSARPAELSGGQRQRVALARATIVPPKVLLCDEPTSALDVSLAASVLNLIHRLRLQFGMTVVFVTHDLGVARFVSDRVAVMYLGRLVETGPVETVIGSPRHPYTQALVAAVPSVRKELPVIIGEPASALAPPPGCAFHPRCPRATKECTTFLGDVRTTGPHPATSHHERHEVACLHHEAVTR